jgi:hypothetical protein
MPAHVGTGALARTAEHSSAISNHRPTARLRISTQSCSGINQSFINPARSSHAGSRRYGRPRPYGGAQLRNFESRAHRTVQNFDPELFRHRSVLHQSSAWSHAGSRGYGRPRPYGGAPLRNFESPAPRTVENFDPELFRHRSVLHQSSAWSHAGSRGYGRPRPYGGAQLRNFD